MMRCSFRTTNHLSDTDFAKLEVVRVVRVNESDDTGFIEFPREKYSEIKKYCIELNELTKIQGMKEG
jgi:hypothetical protein